MVQVRTQNGRSSKRSFVGRIRAAASDIISRANLASQAGLTFGGRRDLYEALGYRRDLTATDFRERYDRGGIAARIVEAMPRATWRGGVELVEDEDPEKETKFEEAWNALDDRVHVWSTILKADILAGLGRFAVLLIGAPGKLEEPLTKLRRLEEIAYLTPFSERDVVIQTLEDDPQSPRFGLPKTYSFSRMTPDISNKTGARQSSSMTRQVDWTRVIHVADGVLDEQFYGTPRLKVVWNYLDDLDKVTGGGAEAFWRRADQGMQIDIDQDIEMGAEDMTALEAEAEEYLHGLRRFMRTRGVKLIPMGSDVANFNPQVDSILTLISGATGIPKRILTGSEMGELASTQDRSNWADRVRDRRTEYAAPQVLMPFVDRLIELGAMPKPKDGYMVSWPEISALGEMEKADVADKWSGLNQKQGEVVVTGEEIRDQVLGLAPLKEVMDIDQEADLEQDLAENEPELAAARSKWGRLKAAQKKSMRMWTSRHRQNLGGISTRPPTLTAVK